jgi:two-component system CheB/CheR fusion protein
VIPSVRWEPPAAAAAAPAYPVERAGIGELHYQLLERYAPPSVLVDDNLDVLHVSEHAGRLLQVAGGAPSRQLLRLIHPALRIDLRTAIHAAKLHPTGNDVRVVRYDEAGTPRAVEIRVRSVPQPGSTGGTLLVLFDELDPLGAGDAPTQAANTALEPMVRDLEDQLRGTRDQLRTTVEQYETSLEELKASNEELQAMNEELRSATEELETSKEELQSVNEELTTLNVELKLKVDEISHTNSDLQNLMSSSDVGRPLAHLTHQLEADDLPGLARSVLQSLRTVEREVRSRDGRRYLARMLPYRSLEDRIDGVVLTFVEVSDLRDAVDARIRSEAALHTSEERLGFALRNAPLIVVGLDDQLRTRWGYVLGERLEPAGTLGEPISPGLIDLLAPGHADQLADVAHRVMQRGGALRVELDVLLHGERRSSDYRVERNELGLSIVGFDVTPSKLAEATLLDADRRKDEFLATLSHELRNPLTPLQVALDVANLAGNDPAQLAHTRKVMERQVQQLTRLVDDLLDVSRISQGKIALERLELDPVRAVEDALEATRPLIQLRGHQLTIELPKNTCRVIGDHARLTQVITNLLNNAAKYTPPGGLIQLSLVPDFARRVIVLRIRDNGAGIEPDMLSKIFEIFVQCRDAQGRSQGGLGIGLNLVRRLVELHGGTVSASSAGLGHGSEFVVELPLMAGGLA